ncbi:MAG TPA: CBS domain-containing protein, partial [Niastella sp.]|nr:CBS domain-containing protein [Niastella sp.]
SNLFSNHHPTHHLLGSLVKRKNIFITNDNSLRTAVELMAKENVDVLPVVDTDNNQVVGLLSYQDVLATYKYSIAEHEKKQPHISLKRQGLKVWVHGQKMVGALKRKEK